MNELDQWRFDYKRGLTEFERSVLEKHREQGCLVCAITLMPWATAHTIAHSKSDKMTVNKLLNSSLDDGCK